MESLWAQFLESQSIKIKNYGVEDYVKALRDIKLRPHQTRMFEAHYYAPQHIITASQMATAMGYKNHSAANLHYGHIGKMIGQQLKPAFSPEQTVFVCATFEKPGKEWFWVMRPQLAQALENLGLVSGKSIKDDVTEPEQGLSEGRAITVNSKRYERNPIAREKCLLHYGCSCAICGVNLANIYGEVAQGYIHVHHLKQLSDISAQYQVDPIENLRPVCPNCHAIIHMRNPPFDTDEVKKLISTNSSANKCETEG
ncbi:MAG: HNH endonuclease [Elusimicrobiales bacterium]|nr:HNH endonuclease [Elusimicrobiales bacterium]